MIYIVYAVHVLVCLFLILVVLLQQGKGADLSVFGGGSTQTAFGAVGATSLLHKLTVTSFVLFILTTMTIAVSQNAGQSSVMSGVATEAPAEPTEEVPATAGTPEEAAAAATEAVPDVSAERSTEMAPEAAEPAPPDGEQNP